MSEINGPGAYARRYRETKSMLANKGRGTTSILRRSDFIDEQVAKGRSKKQALATWKLLRKRSLAPGSTAKRKSRAPRKSPTYGKGQYKALKAKAGGKTHDTFLYKTASGRTKHIPDHAILGFSSYREMQKVYKSGSEKERSSLSKRLHTLMDRREKAAQRAAEKVRQGTAWFSPNGKVITYKEWKKTTMKPNKAKKSRKKKSTTKSTFVARVMRKGRSRAQANSLWKAIQTNKAKGRKKKATPKKRATAKRSTTKRRTTSKRRSTKKASSKRKATKSRKRKQTPKARRAAVRNLKTACKKVSRMKANGSKASSRSRYAYSKSFRKNGKKKSYRKNAAGAQYKMELMNAFRYGGIVTGGMLVHRIASNALNKNLDGMEMFAKSSPGYRSTVSSVIVALIAVPLTVRVLPKHAGVAAAGIMASLLYGLAKDGLAKLDKPELVQAISSYPNADGYAQYSGVGAYYEYSPHQVFSGAGGLGHDGQMLTQAAAGVGEFYEVGPGAQGVEQAAAGLQQMYANGTGEYYATGMEGFGEYESVPYEGGPQPYTYDGLQPNLHSAEQALNVAEAASGLGGHGGGEVLTQAAAGFGGIPLQSEVDPMIRALDIPDSPGGSRAGILAGGDGIFG